MYVELAVSLPATPTHQIPRRWSVLTLPKSAAYQPLSHILSGIGSP